jgi:hypothetical protein
VNVSSGSSFSTGAITSTRSTPRRTPSTRVGCPFRSSGTRKPGPSSTRNLYPEDRRDEVDDAIEDLSCTGS